MAEFGKKNVTIADIARAAGVSKATVSRYINGKFNLISEASQARIKAVIDVTDYNPNSIAQSLRTNQSFQIGVVVADISSPFSSALIRGVSSELLPAGYVPLFMDSKNSLELETRFIKILMARKIDGLIVNTSDGRNPSLIQLACTGFPIVLCDRLVDDYNFSYVGSDHTSPVLAVMDHLKDEGFEKVAFFTQDYSHNSARSLRLAAYRQKMAQLYPQYDAQVLTKLIRLEDLSETKLALRALMDSCKDGQTPAIIASNSVTGMHVISAAAELGISFPEDCGFCCPDDFGWENAINWPILGGGITTFNVHPNQIGVASAAALLRLMKNKEDKSNILVPSELVVRDSTRLRTRKSSQ